MKINMLSCSSNSPNCRPNCPGTKSSFRLSQKRRFGSSSEQTHPEQLQLFNEAEVEAKPSLAEPTMEDIASCRRSKKQGQRQEQLEDLPVANIEYRLIPVSSMVNC